MAEFQELEEVDAVRLSWNVWPNSRIEAAKCVIPFGACYTPLKQLPNMPVVDYEPVPCKSCGSVLNPHARVDFMGKLWICPFCHSRNHFPPEYQAISESNIPAELHPSYSTIEYKLLRVGPFSAPTFLFIVDTSNSEEELDACKTAVTQALQMLPEETQVGLITYGTHVHVHELGFQECSKSYVFRGSKEYTAQQVQDQLGLARSMQRAPVSPGKRSSTPGAGRFILPISQCEYVITGVLEELQRDAFPPVAEQRPSRCTGTALAVATALLGACIPQGSGAARMQLFVGGPGTEGGGKVVEKDLTEPIRSHKDLAKDAAPLFRKAKKFFDGLAGQLVAQGHSLDVFSCALDQVGLAEMKLCVESTGGLVVQTDTFTNPIFKESLKRMFARPGEEGSIGLASLGTFEVHSSRDIKISGLLGAASSLEKKGPAVADTAVGVGGTTAWKLCSLDRASTYAVLFEITAANKDQPVDPNMAGQQFFLQFVTKYLHEDASMRCRVTTITRSWTDGNNLPYLISGFDQEASACLLARLASHKMETEDDFDATRWLDRTLIRLCSRFGNYSKDDPHSFALSAQMSLYPQFMFHFRRSQFIQVFGHSPDETAYARLQLARECVPEAMLMIQPMLSAYSFNGVEPVLLDVASIQPDRILLLDAYFYVVVFSGTTIASWRKANYHALPEHAAFAELLQAPREEASSLLRRRFPQPHLVECDHNGSQARFLLAKLNPSATYNSSSAMSSEVLMTDDVSLQVFSDHLKKLAVQS